MEGVACLCQIRGRLQPLRVKNIDVLCGTRVLRLGKRLVLSDGMRGRLLFGVQ